MTFLDLAEGDPLLIVTMLLFPPKQASAISQGRARVASNANLQSKCPLIAVVSTSMNVSQLSHQASSYSDICAHYKYEYDNNEVTFTAAGWTSAT